MFSFMKDPFPLFLLGLTIIAPAVFFLIFLQFFQKTRLAFKSCITCPEKKQRANVHFMARFGDKGPYRDIGSCSLLGEENKVSCQKACLLSHDVLETPFASERKPEATG